MRELRFTFNDQDDSEKLAELIYSTNREANLDGIYYEAITIRSFCSKDRNDELMKAIKSRDGGVTSSICEIVKSFY